MKYRLKRLFPTIPKAYWKNYKKSYLLGFLEELDYRFKMQVQSSNEFALAVQIPNEVLEEQKRRLGNLKTTISRLTVENIDQEAYRMGRKHAKETKLMPDELIDNDEIAY